MSGVAQLSGDIIILFWMIQIMSTTLDQKSEIEEAAHNPGVCTGVTSKGFKIDMPLSNIRVFTIRHSKELAREKRKEENEKLKFAYRKSRASWNYIQASSSRKKSWPKMKIKWTSIVKSGDCY